MPPYAESMASKFALQDFENLYGRKKLAGHGALQYMDIEAIETDSEMSSYEGSDGSISLSQSSSHSVSD